MRPRILIVEDSKSDVFLIREAMAAAGIQADVHVVSDGEQAIRFFDRTDADPSEPAPALVVLDINLPKRQGGEVLQHLRRSCRSGNTLVIVVSSSNSALDRKTLMDLGANRYFQKPSQYDQFMRLGDLIKDMVGGGIKGT